MNDIVWYDVTVINKYHSWIESYFKIYCRHCGCGIGKNATEICWYVYWTPHGIPVDLA